MATYKDPRFNQIQKMSFIMVTRPSKQLGLAIFRKVKQILAGPKPMIQQKLF